MEPSALLLLSTVLQIHRWEPKLPSTHTTVVTGFGVIIRTRVFILVIVCNKRQQLMTKWFHCKSFETSGFSSSSISLVPAAAAGAGLPETGSSRKVGLQWFIVRGKLSFKKLKYPLLARRRIVYSWSRTRT